MIVKGAFLHCVKIKIKKTIHFYHFKCYLFDNRGQ